jgi:hypothetical protein
MKARRFRRLFTFLCIFALCGAAVYGVWHIWFNPYRGTVTAFRPSEKLETVLSGQQAAEDLDYPVRRLEERHPACINGLPDKVRIEYEQERMRIGSLPKGEIPGNMPSCYGDNLYFQTPNAGLVFTVSYKYFVRPDASKSELPLLPDITVPAGDALTEAMKIIGNNSASLNRSTIVAPQTER